MNQFLTRRTFLASSIAGSTALSFTSWASASWLESLAGHSVDEREFLNAARAGQLEALKKLLASNPTLLQSRNAKGVSAYGISLLNGHDKVARFLKEYGFQSDLHEAALANDWQRLDALTDDDKTKMVERVNSIHPIGGTAMYAAAVGGAGPDMWRVYALCGDPNKVADDRGVSPLQAALRFRDLATAELTAAALVSNNTDPNPSARGDLPPLHISAARGSVELTEMLIRLGADVDAKDAEGKTALDLARSLRQRETVRMLENQDSIPRTCQSSRTAYDVDGKPYKAPDISDIPLAERRAVVGQSHGNLEFVKSAVGNTPRLAHSVATTSEICVEACAHIGRKPIVEFLLKSGAPYSLPTAVMMNDRDTVIKYLDEDPRRIQERGAHDFPLLWYPMIGRCPIEMLELLVERGAEVEQQHFLGATALHWAVLRGDVNAIEFLVSKGADVNRKSRKFNGKTETPLMMAREDSIKKLLVAHGAR